MTDTNAVFLIGLGVGGLAMLVPWVIPQFTAYVWLSKCPKPSHCPHHKAAWSRLVDQRNHDERNGPTRPKM